MIVISLPWPSKALHANSRAHWSARGAATSKARLDAWVVCRAAGIPKGNSARLTFQFHPKAKGRLPDIQNLPHMCKAYIDGIADHIGCDDAKFTPVWPEKLSERRGHGEIVIGIEVSE